MLLTEFVGEFLGRVSLVYDDALLFIGSKVHIDEEERWVGVIEVVIIIFVATLVILIAVFTLCALLIRINELRQLSTLWDVTVSLKNEKVFVSRIGTLTLMCSGRSFYWPFSSSY